MNQRRNQRGLKKILTEMKKKKTQNTKTAKVVLTRMLIITNIKGKKKKVLHKELLTLHPKELEKQEQINPIVSRS